MKFLKNILISESIRTTNGMFTKFEDEFLKENVESIIIPEFQALLEVRMLTFVLVLVINNRLT